MLTCRVERETEEHHPPPPLLPVGRCNYRNNDGDDGDDEQN